MATQSGHIQAELDFQSRMMMFGRPTIGILAPYGTCPNPIFLERISHTLEIYRKTIRPINASGSLIFHHTPELDGINPKGTGILEIASNNGDRCVVGIFQLSDPQHQFITVFFRGVDISKKYHLTMDNSGHTTTVSGYKLANEGVRVALPTALVSELLIAEEDKDSL